MIIIGLTGTIASGKTTISEMFTAKAIPVHNADAVVHKLLGPQGEAVDKICAAFGTAFGRFDEGVDRHLLGTHVFADGSARKTLEAILHPMVSTERNDFLQKHQKAKSPLVILDVPLLFETDGDKICDYVIVTNARAETIRQRALIRDGMNEEKLAAILQSQMPPKDRISRADFVLDTDQPLEQTRAELDNWLASLI